MHRPRQSRGLTVAQTQLLFFVGTFLSASCRYRKRATDVLRIGLKSNISLSFFCLNKAKISVNSWFRLKHKRIKQKTSTFYTYYFSFLERPYRLKSKIIVSGAVYLVYKTTRKNLFIFNSVALHN